MPAFPQKLKVGHRRYVIDEPSVPLTSSTTSPGSMPDWDLTG